MIFQRVPYHSKIDCFRLLLLLLAFVHLANSVQPISISGGCKTRCDSKREKGNKQPFTFHCYSDKEACLRDCESCPKEVCDETISESSYTKWHCPSDELNKDARKIVPEPQATRSYKGTCKDRCDASQGGGPKEFELDCETVYETPEERQRCRQVCTEECGIHDCEDPDGDGRLKIKCRGDRLGSEGASSRRLIKQKNETGSEIERLEKELGDKEIDTNEFLLYISVLVILLLVLIGVLICQCCRTRNQIKLLQRTGLAPMAAVQQVKLGHRQMDTTNPSMGAMWGGEQGQEKPPGVGGNDSRGGIGSQQSMEVGAGQQP